jgi:predicted nucleic acid-binding protein
VAENIVLDTSAIFALTDNEPGADQVQAHIVDAIAGNVRLYGSFVTLTEVHYITLQEQGEQVARERLADLSALPIQWLHSDVPLCGEAAKLKAVNRISFADSFVAATALRFDAILLHRDPELRSLASSVKQSMLPPK